MTINEAKSLHYEIWNLVTNYMIKGTYKTTRDSFIAEELNVDYFKNCNLKVIEFISGDILFFDTSNDKTVLMTDIELDKLVEILELIKKNKGKNK